MKLIAIALAGLFAATSMAAAQEKLQVTYSGFLGVERLSGAGISYDYFYGDVDVGLRFSLSDDTKVGADVGFETIRFIDSSFGPNALTAKYAAAVLETRYGKLSIGMPRGVLDQYFAAPSFGGTELLGLEFSSVSLGTDLFRLLSMEADLAGANIYGIRYDGAFGKIGIGASINRITAFDYNISQFVARYDGGNWTASLGTTVTDSTGFLVNATNLEVQGRRGKFSGGVLLSKANTDYVDTAVQAFASYDMTDQVKFTLQGLRVQYDAANSQDYWSVDMHYTHPSGALVQAGLVKADTFNSNIVGLSVGYKF